MKILILHLSDLHLKNDKNIILGKKEYIFNAIRNIGADHFFVIITGDIAYSGKESEYYQAIELLDHLKKEINQYTGKEVSFILLPGNHDCNFESSNNSVRETLIKNIQSCEEKSIDKGIVEECCKVQSDFLKFAQCYHDENKIIYHDNLLTIFEYAVGKYKVIFRCYNTSWMSQKQEQPAKMYFPIEFCFGKQGDFIADLVISLVHHPVNWQKPANSRKFREHLEETAHIVLTGHEHEFSKFSKSDLEGNYTNYIEGCILQSGDNPEHSGFNVIVFDLEQQKQKISNYKWDTSLSLYSPTHSEWIDYPIYKPYRKPFVLDEEFEKGLNDPGASYTHPNKSPLFWEDFFVFPDLKDLQIDESKIAIEQVLSSDTLLNIDKIQNKILLIGAEKSGKSCLLKKLFKNYYNHEYIPLLIDGHDINSSSMDNFNKTLSKSYIAQYSEKTIENFKQADNSKKVLIIDDFDKSKLNSEHRAIFLKRVNELYPNIMLTVNELYQIEELVYEGNDSDGKVFKDYKQYQIKEFGHLLRNELINKWNKIGVEAVIEEVKLLRKNDTAKQIIDITIGKNLVPAYPLFLLTILQSIEAGTSQNLKDSAYGRYYECLITAALSKLNKSHGVIDTYYNYITELAYYFSKNQIREVPIDDLKRFHDEYCTNYSITLSMSTVVSGLKEAPILEEKNNIYKFKYKYIYYFFVARYIANNEEIRKKIVDDMCKRLYKEEFANIIMFLTHHSKDPYILEVILRNAKLLFSEYEPIKLKGDISSVNDLLREIPKLALESKDVRENRQRNLKGLDRAESLGHSKSTLNHSKSDFDLSDDVRDLDLISKLNLAFKTVEILGQIIKNYYGSLKGEIKFDIGQEAYFIGLRALNSIFVLIKDNTDYIVNEIQVKLLQKEIEGKDKREEFAKKFLFHFYVLFTHAFVKKISISVGSENLEPTFRKILEKNDFPSVKLIDMAIRLDHYKTFPLSDVTKLKEEISENYLPYILLKHLVINYIYMFPTDYKTKQNICSLLDIRIGAQREMDRGSTRKKREK